MMEVERSPVIDEHEALVPEEHIGIARRAVDVGYKCIKPDNRRGKQRVQRAGVERIESKRAGEVIEGEVETSAGLDECLDFKIRLGASQHKVQFDEDDFGYRQSQGASNFARHQFGYQCLRPL